VTLVSASQVREAQFLTTQVMLETDSLKEAAPQIISAVCTHLGWNLGAVWEADPAGSKLRCIELWDDDTADFSEFAEATRQFTFEKGNGLPGRVLDSREPAWIADVTKDENFPRLSEAMKSGLRGGFAFPIISERKVVGVLEFFSRDVQEPDEPLLSMMATIGNQIGQFMQRKQVEQELLESQSRLEFLSESSRVLSSSLDLGLVLQRVAQLAVPRVADWCAVELVQEDETIERVAVAHIDPVKAELAQQIREKYPVKVGGSYPVARVIETGEPEIYSELPDELISEVASTVEHARLLRSLGHKSWMILPLRVRGRILGALSLAGSDTERRFDKEDLSLAHELADRAALAIDNARLYSERSRTARILQQSLLPPRLPRIPGFGLAARYHAAGISNEVGGDFYDVFRTGTKNWSIVIGDVCGKGPEAAVMTALARYTLRAAAMERRKPYRILRMLNDAIVMEHADYQFCSSIFMSLRLGGDAPVVTMSSGGHPLPLVLRKDGRVEFFGEFGTLLGLYADLELKDYRLVLEPGDAILLYTDGLIEARGEGGIFGEERLISTLRSCVGLSAEDIAARLEKEVLGFQKGEPRDDIAYLVVKSDL
jgi:serine phosphatase RsbU (regulator of sigma subunit)